MLAVDSHPRPAELEAFALGELNGDSFAAVEEHVASCPECQRAAAAAPADTFISLLRGGEVAVGVGPGETGPASDYRRRHTRRRTGSRSAIIRTAGRIDRPPALPAAPPARRGRHGHRLAGRAPRHGPAGRRSR